MPIHLVLIKRMAHKRFCRSFCRPVYGREISQRCLVYASLRVFHISRLLSGYNPALCMATSVPVAHRHAYICTRREARCLRYRLICLSLKCIAIITMVFLVRRIMLLLCLAFVSSGSSPALSSILMDSQSQYLRAFCVRCAGCHLVDQS